MKKEKKKKKHPWKAGAEVGHDRCEDRQRHVPSSRKTPALEGWDWSTDSRLAARKCPSVQAQRRCSTHWVDDALQSLKAVIYRKHMVLTVRNPGELRTNTPRCVTLEWGELKKATGAEGVLSPFKTQRNLSSWLGLTEKPLVIMNFPAASLERAWRVGSSFYICFNTLLLRSRGKIAQLDEQFGLGWCIYGSGGRPLAHFLPIHSNFCWQLFSNQTNSSFLSEQL